MCPNKFICTGPKKRWNLGKIHDSLGNAADDDDDGSSKRLDEFPKLIYNHAPVFVGMMTCALGNAFSLKLLFSQNYAKWRPKGAVEIKL